MGNLLDVLILFGALQGFITAGLLLSKKRHQSSHLLACILFIISLACLNIYLFHVLPAQVPVAFQILEKITPLILIMPLGPLIYFHVRSLAGIPFSAKQDRVHFLPTSLDFIPAFAFAIATILYFFGIISSFQPRILQEINAVYEKYLDIPRWISTSAYLIITLKFVSKNKLSQTKWVKQLLRVFIIFQIFWLLHLIPYIIPSTSNWLLSSLGWYPIYIPLTVLVYWLGISGLIQLRDFRANTTSESELRQTANKLLEIMETDKLYLDATLSLQKLIDKTGISQKELSSTLNQYLGKSFNEWVNEYRVNEVKSKFADEKYKHLSITGIALESGFNSQATFQRSFKGQTQMTPKAFRASVMEK